jgi:hypothetical protein
MPHHRFQASTTKFPVPVRITATDFVMVEAHVRPGRICHPRFAAACRLRVGRERRPGISNLSAPRPGTVSRVHQDQLVVQPRLMPAWRLSALEIIPRHACSLGRYYPAAGSPCGHPATEFLTPQRRSALRYPLSRRRPWSSSARFFRDICLWRRTAWLSPRRPPAHRDWRAGRCRQSSPCRCRHE